MDGQMPRPRLDETASGFPARQQAREDFSEAERLLEGDGLDVNEKLGRANLTFFEPCAL